MSIVETNTEFKNTEYERNKNRLFEGLRCLYCGNALVIKELHEIKCTVCTESYPLLDGIPVLINESKSIFTFNDFRSQNNLFFDISRAGTFKSKIGALIPSLSLNTVSKRNFALIEQVLKAKDNNSRILILGGSIEGEGIGKFLHVNGFTFIESDVSFGPRTNIILDAHNIPFADKTFDCVVAQAVLEHVVDPIQCVAEIHRVLKPGGIVYSEIPFMQQVHGGPYDFTRFTLSGHRRLFRWFEELKSGAIAGPGTALAWSYSYLLTSLLGHTEKLRLAVKVFARLTGFWIKYLDYFTNRNRRSIDAASGTFFIGTKSDKVLSDKELIKYYK